MLIKHRDNFTIYLNTTLLSERIYGMARQLQDSYEKRITKDVKRGGRALL
jgi:hypothetical protein